MTALACLRIMIEADRAVAGGDVLAALVGKVAGAFLETRWLWPRRHGEIAPYAFLLADPRATRLDPETLVALSDELHMKLFGDDGPGRIRMAMLEGEQEAVTRFAAVETAVLRKIISEGGVVEGVPGRITEISRHGVRVVSPDREITPFRAVAAAASAGNVTPIARRALPTSDHGVETSYRAVWCALKETFIGSGLAARRKGARAFHSIVDGPGEQPGGEAPEFDLTCLEAAPRALVGTQGLLFLPISFDSTVHRPTRECYLDALETLPQEGRPRLAAAVYNVPRSPSFGAVRQLRAFLNPYFSFVDLQTSDPAFEIDALMMEAVNSVTLALPESDEGARLATAARFMSHRDSYQRRRIWPAITNVRTRRELNHCIKLKTPFLSGRAVCDHLVAPADPVRYVAGRLPLRETGAPTLAQRAAMAV